MEDKVSYIDENSNLKPCPWCGTTLGCYAKKYSLGVPYYKFIHSTERCNIASETDWCRSKEECNGMWNDRVIGFS
jgi:hypothetical protein